MIFRIQILYEQLMPATSKQLKKVMADIFDRYGAEITVKTADAVKNLAFEYETIASISTAKDDYPTYDEIDDFIAEGDAKTALIQKQYNEGLVTDDERYKHLVGKMLILPLVHREIPVIADDYVETDFGTGVVKITPAHDPNDYEVGLRHDLPIINVMMNCLILRRNVRSIRSCQLFRSATTTKRIISMQ